MRLVLIGPVYPYRGGIAHFTTLLSKALRKRGHQVLVASFKRQYPHWLFPGQTDKDPSQKPLKVEDAHYWLDSVNPITWFATVSRIRRYSPDAIVLQWWTTYWAPVWFMLGFLNRLFLRYPLVYYCHNVLPHEARWWDAGIAKATLRWGSLFIVQSEDEKNRLRALLPGAKIRITPLPAFDLFGEQRVPRDEARRQLQLPADALVLLFFGMVRAYKGLGSILEAIPDIEAAEASRKVILLVAGEFWEDKQPYLDLIEQLGIGDSVILDDRYIPDEEVPVYFSAADALAAPYLAVTGSAVTRVADSFGLPVLHSLADAKLLMGHSEARATIGDVGYPVPPATMPQRGTPDHPGYGMKAWMKAPVPTWETLVELLETATKVPVSVDRAQGSKGHGGRD